MQTLHLIPVGLGPSKPQLWLPPIAQSKAAQLRYFVVENAKSARAFLKQIDTTVPIQEVLMLELKPQLSVADIRAWFAALPGDAEIGLVSEAGCPAVADPGAAIVAMAHAQGMRVRPWVGPSSIMLGLMASGLEGQRFAFHGYAPVKAPQREQQLRAWELESRRLQQTQILIETPYRNAAMLEAMLGALRSNTRLCIASNLNCSDESISTYSIEQWRRLGAPDFSKKPSLFLFLAS